MKKTNFRKENGAISALVMMSMLFLLFTVIGVYRLSSKRAQTQIQSSKMLENVYSENDNVVFKEEAVEDVPIYTAEQLKAFKEGKPIIINGKKYTSTNAKLQNDIFIKDLATDYNNVEKGDYDIYFYDDDDGNYYDSDGYSINLTKKLGYSDENIKMHLDGIMNVPFTHDNESEVWKDLSGNSNDIDKTLSNNYYSIENNEYISFDDKLSELFKGDNTIELVLNIDSVISNGTINIIGNNQINYGFKNGKVSLIKPENAEETNVTIDDGNIHTVSFVYTKNDGKVKIYIDGSEKGEITSNDLKNYNSVWKNVNIGKNSVIDGFEGKIYSVRIYEAALETDDISNNYSIDSSRFKDDE